MFDFCSNGMLTKLSLSQGTSISCHIKCFYIYRFSESQAFYIKRAPWHFLIICFTSLVNISGLISEQAKYYWHILVQYLRFCMFLPKFYPFNLYKLADISYLHRRYELCTTFHIQQYSFTMLRLIVMFLTLAH